MEEIDKWAAEQCGVGFTTNHKKQVVAWFTGSIDERVYWEFEWTIQDCRCLVIVCKKFSIDIIAGDTDKAINELRRLYEKAR